MRSSKGVKKRIQHWFVIAICLMVYDVIAANLSYFLALMVRFDLVYSQIPSEYYQAYYRFAPIYTVVCLAVFWAMRLYKSVWRFASYSELLRVIAANIVTSVIHFIGFTLLFRRMPISYYLGGVLVQFCLTAAVRFAYRLVLLLRASRSSNASGSSVMIVGAGNSGQMLARDIRISNESSDAVRCFIDDNPNKCDTL